MQCCLNQYSMRIFDSPSMSPQLTITAGSGYIILPGLKFILAINVSPVSVRFGIYYIIKSEGGENNALVKNNYSDKIVIIHSRFV